jgi:adenylate cyclase
LPGAESTLAAADVRAGACFVRVRRAGPRAYLTIKGEPEGITRTEFGCEAPVEEAEVMQKELCGRLLIEKTASRWATKV